MKFGKRPVTVVAPLFAALLSLGIGNLNARDGDPSPPVVASAQTAKQQCMHTCRARYRDCRRLNQLPPYECQSIYQDCAQYACTGLGPG